jgi:hypothetical protein
VDRRTAIQWVIAALAAAPAWQRIAWSAADAAQGAPPATGAKGYGTDPDLVRSYRAGELWPLTFTEQQRKTAAALCGLVIPADERSPSAAGLEVHVFIDEWISAPYPRHAGDRAQVLEGLAWLDEESKRRFTRPFAELGEPQQRTICDGICWTATAPPELAKPASFFARFRDLTADGFYTSPQGMKDIGYVGNVPLPAFDGPPAQALKKAGIS